MTTKASPDDCILIENSLALWVGGDLEREVQARVDRHLSECERCSAAARSLESARRALIAGLSSRRAQASPRIDVWPAVRETLHREGLFAREPRPLAQPLHATVPASNRPRALRYGGVGLAAAAAVLLGFLLGRLGGDAAQLTQATSAPIVSSNDGVTRDPALFADRSEPRSARAVVPVSDGARLRPLAPGEARLSESAQNIDWYINPGSFGNPNTGSPASMQNVSTRRW